MHPLIPSASKLLGLPTPNPSNKSELTETLLSELLPSHEDETTSLQTLGCTATDKATTTDFLLSTLLAHRILQHKSQPPQHETPDRDFADALSRLTLALGLQPPVITSSTLSAYIASLLPNLPEPSSPISQPLNEQQMETLQAIQSRLQAEHRTRVELLLTRFNVTVSAFSRSEHANNHPFFYDAHIERMRRAAQAVSTYQAIAAGQQVLKEPEHVTSSDSVKTFVMGQVPDRGGRLDKPFMPTFKGRLPSVAEMRGGKKKAKGKGKGKGKRRHQFE